MVFLVLLLAAQVFATFPTTSYLSQCPSSAGCLNGMKINVTITEYDRCKLKFCYRFRGSRCDLSNFVVEQASFGNAVVSGYVSAYDKGCGPCANHFCDSFTSPIKYDITSSDDCRNNQFEVCFLTQYKVVGDIFIGMKGGQDCMGCRTKGPVSNPNYQQCTIDSQCQDQNICTRDYCSSCGECKRVPIPGCQVTTGTTGFVPPPQTTGTTGFVPPPQTTGTTGFVPPPQTTGTTGVPPTTGTTAVPPTTGTTGFVPPPQTTGTTAVPPTTGTTGVPPTTGTTGVPPPQTTTQNPTGITPSDLTTGNPPTQCVDVFGCASMFNVFVFEDYYGDIDVQGRLAAGGNVSFGEHFSVGDQLFSEQGFSIAAWNAMCLVEHGSMPDDCNMCDKCGKAVFVAGNAFHTSPNSRIYFGNWLGSDLTDLKVTDPTYPEYATLNHYGAKILNDDNCTDLTENMENQFNTIRDLLTTYSNNLCQLTPTGEIDFSTGDADICAYCDMPQQVISVDAADLEQAKLVTIQTISTTSTLIINVHGVNFELSDINLEALKDIADHVIWNFCDAETLYIHDVVVWGTILAPHAKIIGGNGAINGHVFAESFVDSTQVNWVQFHGSTQFNWIPFDACVDLEETEVTRYEIDRCKEEYLAQKEANSSPTYESGAGVIGVAGALIVSMLILNVLV